MRTAASKALVLACTAASLLMAGCERPPMDTVQRGYRGTGMVHVENPRALAAKIEASKLPEVMPAMAPGSPPAKTVYKNVPVLGELGVAEFTRLMVSMTAWVSPEQGCNYCHDPNDLASDKPYAKVVARRMLEMTRHVNADWKTHVGETGVTCYTCHRGKPVPEGVWFTDAGKSGSGMMGDKRGQNTPTMKVGLTALPTNLNAPYLQNADSIRVVGAGPLPTGGGATILQTEATYGLMMHFSAALGVNCTFCHNSRSFAAWDSSSPQRTTAWHGIRLVRDLNSAYLDPLKPTYPPERLGPEGDAPKLNCITCHQGAYKPLMGASLLKDFPELAAK